VLPDITEHVTIKPIRLHAVRSEATRHIHIHVHIHVHVPKYVVPTFTKTNRARVRVVIVSYCHPIIRIRPHRHSALSARRHVRQTLSHTVGSDPQKLSHPPSSQDPAPAARAVATGVVPVWHHRLKHAADTSRRESATHHLTRVAYNRAGSACASCVSMPCLPCSAGAPPALPHPAGCLLGRQPVWRSATQAHP